MEIKINYQKKLDEIINNLDYTPKLLLHSCCAPCSSYCLSYLNDYFNITVLYYNPNIEPYDEYIKRKKEQIRLIKTMPKTNKIDIIDCDYDNDIYHEKIKGTEDECEGKARCSICYYLRLDYTAKKAKELGYEYFGTTLTVSPYKNSEKLNTIGEKLAKIYNVKFLYSDFKKKNGYKKSIEYSKIYNLYRQDYCGCIYSKQERENKVNK